MWGWENEENEWKHWLIVKDGGGKWGGGFAGIENWTQPQSLTSFSQANAKQSKHQYVSARLETNLAPQRHCAGPRNTTSNILLVYVFWAMSLHRIEGKVSFVESRGLLETDSRSRDVTAKLNEWKSGGSEVNRVKDGAVSVTWKKF